MINHVEVSLTMVSFRICQQPFFPNGGNGSEQAGRNHFEDMLAMVDIGLGVRSAENRRRGLNYPEIPDSCQVLSIMAYKQEGF